jgi:REP element-mobilizing transposase RayT
MRGRATNQLPLGFPEWGGARPGAGRKPSGERPRNRHAARSRFPARHPVHVTLRLAHGLPSLRSTRAHRVLAEALARGAERPCFRIVEYSAQSNHLHLVCEADGREHLARGIQGLCVRIARSLNRLWGRGGRVFDERYHDHVLRTPREVRNALAYVLTNARRHGIHHLEGIDPCSSAAWFEDWSDGMPDTESPAPLANRPLPRARTWLLNSGWMRSGPLARLS